MGFLDSIPRFVWDWWTRRRSHQRDQTDRVAAYMRAAADALDRIRVEEPPALLGACEELAGLMAGLSREPTFTVILSDEERNDFQKLLFEAVRSRAVLLLLRGRLDDRARDVYARGLAVELADALTQSDSSAKAREALAQLAGRLRAAEQRLRVSTP